jgi:hypothetical protein
VTSDPIPPPEESNPRKQVIQTGKFFEMACVNKENKAQAVEKLKVFMPVARKRFHEALDEVEIELVNFLASIP